MARSDGSKSRLLKRLITVRKIGWFLARDCEFAMARLRTATSEVLADNITPAECDFAIKTVIRCFMGLVDGLSFAMRKAVLECADSVGLDLPDKERARLSEKKYDSIGGVIMPGSIAHLKTNEGFKLALQWFPRLFGSQFELDTSGAGWRGLKRIAWVRGNFTHPEVLEDLWAIEAYDVLEPTFNWTMRQIADLFGASPFCVEI